jgi:hypothetical protein
MLAFHNAFDQGRRNDISSRLENIKDLLDGLYIAYAIIQLILFSFSLLGFLRSRDHVGLGKAGRE